MSRGRKTIVYQLFVWFIIAYDDINSDYTHKL